MKFCFRLTFIKKMAIIKIRSDDMKKNKRGEIATIITLGAIIVLGLVSFISTKFLSKNQITTKSNAEGISCTANTVPPNAPPFPPNCQSVTSTGSCVQDGLHNNLYPFANPWIKCGQDGHWYGPCQDKQTCLSDGTNSQTNTDNQQSAQPAAQSAQPSSQSSTGETCGGVKTGYGNCSAVSPAGSCVYRSYASVDPHYFNQWIYCCGADNFWYAKDTNSQDPAKGWQSQSECTQAGGTTPASSTSSTSSPSQQSSNPPSPGTDYAITNCSDEGVGSNTDFPLYKKDNSYYSDSNGTHVVDLSNYCPPAECERDYYKSPNQCIANSGTPKNYNSQPYCCKKNNPGTDTANTPTPSPGTQTSCVSDLKCQSQISPSVNEESSDCQQYKCTNINSNYTDAILGQKVKNGVTYYFYNKNCSGDEIVNSHDGNIINGNLRTACEALHKEPPPQLRIMNECTGFSNSSIKLDSWTPGLGLSGYIILSDYSEVASNKYQDTALILPHVPCFDWGRLVYHTGNGNQKNIVKNYINCQPGQINVIVIQGNEWCY